MPANSTYELTRIVDYLKYARNRLQKLMLLHILVDRHDSHEGQGKQTSLG